MNTKAKPLPVTLTNAGIVNNDTGSEISFPPQSDTSDPTTLTVSNVKESFEDLNRAAQSSAATTPTTLISPVDVNDLPDDVKKNLIGFDTMELDQLLLNILNTPGHIYTVDRIILTMWISYQKKYDRMLVIRRLRSLTHQGFVSKQARTRGIYAITEAGAHLLAQSTAAKQ